LKQGSLRPKKHYLRTSTPYKIASSDCFNRSYKDTKKKNWGKDKKKVELFEVLVRGVLSILEQDPRKRMSHEIVGLQAFEPESPFGQYRNDLNNELWKARFSVDSQGGNNFLRLIYVIHEQVHTITLLYIYSHKEWPKRPNDEYLKALFREAGLPLDPEPERE
jgi:hypothetical protein